MAALPFIYYFIYCLIGISVVLQPLNVQINSVSNNILLQLLFDGDKDLSGDVNKYVLKQTLNFNALNWLTFVLHLIITLNPLDNQFLVLVSLFHIAC